MVAELGRNMQLCETAAVLEFPHNAETSGDTRCAVDRRASTYTR